MKAAIAVLSDHHVQIIKLDQLACIRFPMPVSLKQAFTHVIQNFALNG
jgi:hypothetical protein